MATRPPRIMGFAFGSALALGLVLGLVWAMAFREDQARRLYIQFEAYRASAALLEAYRENPEAALVGGPVRGFGLYALDGRPLFVQGSAPTALDPPPDGPIEFQAGPSGSSIRLLRALGAELQGLRGVMGQGMMGSGSLAPGMMGGGNLAQGGLRPRRSWQSPLAPQPLPPPGSPPGASDGTEGGAGNGARLLARLPRSLWLEYGTGLWPRERLLLFGGAAFASLALLGLYLLLLQLFRKNAELQERESRSRELVQLGEAARTLVHEIKNPLAIIKVQAATLRRQAGEVPAAGRASEVIEEEVRRLASLADKIREFLKGGQGEPRLVELGPFLEAFARRYEGGEGGSKLALAAPPAGAKARLDPELLSRALDNLIRNALEADPQGQIELSLAERGRNWEISVADRGPGVAPDLEARLFEPFFSTKEKGSGIGLALARRIAEGAGGGLGYRRRPGGGALFVLELPAA